MADQVRYTHRAEFKGSSVLQDAFYDQTSMRLYITFLNGSVAGYTNVGKGSFDNLVSAPSAGQHYNHYVKGAFPTTHSDVVFVPREIQGQSAPNGPKPPVADDVTGAAKNGNNPEPQFVVTVRLDGTLEFKIASKDVKSAIDRIEKSLDTSAFNGDFSIEGVKKS